MVDSASEAGGFGSGVSDFEDDGEPGFDPSQIENMSEKEKKKWEKNLQSWRIFMDFLVRHIAITTFKYNCFELDDLPQFMIAMEKADGIRATTKLKKGEDKHITSFKTMKDTSELLIEHQYIVEANRIKKFLDIAGRMRGLTMIAGGFYKALKKGKVKGLDKIKYYLDYWKGFTVRTFNYSALNFRNADPETFSELEQKYKVWPTVVRTALNLSQKFLKKASEATGLDMLVKDLKVQQKHMQTAELVLATNIEDTMMQKFAQETNTFTLGSSLLQPLGGPASAPAGGRGSKYDLPVIDDIEPDLLKPIPDNGVLLSLPNELPKEKKKGKKKSGKKGGKSYSASSHKAKTKKKKK